LHGFQDVERAIREKNGLWRRASDFNERIDAKAGLSEESIDNRPMLAGTTRDRVRGDE
jgi:hypothetical protein